MNRMDHDLIGSLYCKAGKECRQADIIDTLFI